MLGRYELIQELAKSQLGPLWVARTPGSDDLVAIRRVSTAAPVTAAEKDALSEGAWWTLEVQHPTIAHGKDVVMSENELGIVTEYTEGEVLRSLLRLSSFKRKPIPLSAALRIALDVLEALQEAEAQAQPLTGGKSSYMCGGLVPDSLLVGSDGKTRLLDIGVGGPCATVGNIARNPEMAAYASPEQFDGELLDISSNLYAVGVMLWEMLAGKRLYVGSTYSAVIERIKGSDPARLDASKPVGGDPIPTAVADAVATAIRGNRAERYQSPKTMMDALGAAAPAATHAEVATLVDDLAGNTLATRRKVIDRALKGESALKPITAPKVAAKPAPAATPTAERKSAPTASAESPLPALVTTKPGITAAAPTGRQRKHTLVGIAPPGGVVAYPPRDKLESIDSAELESISKVEIMPVEPTARELVQVLTTDPAESPKSPPAEGAAADASSPATHLKTKVLGTPAVVPQELKLGAIKPASDLEPPPPPPTADEEAPLSLEPESLSDEELDDDTSEPAADASAALNGEERASDESAVAWLGPPPGVALDEPEAEQAKVRKKRAMKFVGVAFTAALGVLVVALALGGKKGEETTETGTGATEQTPAQTEEPKPVQTEEPKPAAVAEPSEPAAPESEPDKEPLKEPEPEPEPTAEPEKPKPVVRSTTGWRPKTTTTTKSTTKPKPKPKSTFTPSGI
jgi:eukaryotic-like serine/threonine-protein kinase